MDASTTNTTKQSELTSDDFMFSNEEISLFPNFEPLQKKHESFINSFTAQFQPYSTFNFTNLRAWDINNDRKFCLLNGNLVLLLTDYTTKEPFFTLLGENNIHNSILTLLEYVERKHINPNIKFVTQEAVQLIKDNQFHIIEDRSNFDYIYSTEQLAELNGSLFKKKRQLAKRFEKENPEITVMFLDITKKEVREKALALLSKWKINKETTNKTCDTKHEDIALTRIFNDEIGHNVFMTAVLDSKSMIGFGIDEILPNNYSMSHFVKADIEYRGSYEFLNKQIASHLVSQGVRWWNWQQDLSIEGLRCVKLSYRPIHFLKKYIISKDNHTQ